MVMRDIYRIVLLGLMTAIVVTLAGSTAAQEDRDRDRDRDRDAPRDSREARPNGRRDRGRGDRDRRERRVRPRPDEDAEGTEEGMPEARIAPQIEPGMPDAIPYLRARRWRLGVFAVNTDTGVLITRTLPNTPAWRSGLERRDRIVTVDGYQIGYVNGRLYPLGDELQRRADRSGRVPLLVQDCRTGDLVNMDVRLERYPNPIPDFRQR
jgi:hypothetical protein